MCRSSHLLTSAGPLKCTHMAIVGSACPDTINMICQQKVTNYGKYVSFGICSSNRCGLFPLYRCCSFSTGTGFIFEDQFLQISALLPSSNIYGLGEHTTRLRLPTNITLTMFSQDTPPLPSVSFGPNFFGMGDREEDIRRGSDEHSTKFSSQQRTFMECIHFILDWNKMAVLMECSSSIVMPWVSNGGGGGGGGVINSLRL